MLLSTSNRYSNTLFLYVLFLLVKIQISSTILEMSITKSCVFHIIYNETYMYFDSIILCHMKKIIEVAVPSSDEKVHLSVVCWLTWTVHKPSCQSN